MLAVVLALVLLVVGGIALFGALTSDAAAPSSPQATPTNVRSVASPPRSRTASAQSQASFASRSLVIKVTGAPTKVYVAISGNTSQVLENGVLNTGDIRQYDEAPLDVVITNGGAVDVWIYGRRQTKGQPGQKAQWHISAK